MSSSVNTGSGIVNVGSGIYGTGTIVVQSNLNNPSTSKTYVYYRGTFTPGILCENNPVVQAQNRAVIRNKVRYPSSIFTMRIGSKNAYVKPLCSPSLAVPYGASGVGAGYSVDWNQMSDRAVAASQKAYVSRHCNTAIFGPGRPGARAPGGVGCDIKHNSYDRYLNRIKGTQFCRGR